jgi:hypothetical protein
MRAWPVVDWGWADISLADYLAPSDAGLGTKPPGVLQSLSREGYGTYALGLEQEGGVTDMQRFERLACAADIIAAHGPALKVSVLRRTISGGKSFFELVRDGSDPEAVAHILVRTLQRELDQRKRLDARLANRPRKRVDLDDVGAPHLDESA